MRSELNDRSLRDRLNRGARRTWAGNGLSVGPPSWGRILVLGLVSFALLLGSILVAPAPGTAQDMPVPVPTQLSLLYRILTFDGAFEAESPGTVKIGIVFQGRFRASELARLALEDAVKRGTPPPRGEDVEVVGLDLSGTQDVGELIRWSGADFLHVAPLRAVDLGEIVAACRAGQILTTTGVPEYVGEGIAVGIGSKAGRPRILIDREAAEAVGAEFSAELLKLAELISGQDRLLPEALRHRPPRFNLFTPGAVSRRVFVTPGPDPWQP